MHGVPHSQRIEIGLAHCDTALLMAIAGHDFGKEGRDLARRLREFINIYSFKYSGQDTIHTKAYTRKCREGLLHVMIHPRTVVTVYINKKNEIKTVPVSSCLAFENLQK